MQRTLVIGANGQIGCELVEALISRYGADGVIAADIAPRSHFNVPCYETLDVLDAARLGRLVDERDVTQVYQLAALLSVTGERTPLQAWTLNVNGLLNVMELARARVERGKPLKVFWPSSIAAFGPHAPVVDTPQLTVMDPTTIYGISKQAGEMLCQYYFSRFGVDVRSIRYPGIISHKSLPGGGTTDYAVAIFHSALAGQPYRCYLDADTTLPLIYIPDAIRATLELMEVPADCLRVRTAYNVAGFSCSPRQLAGLIAARVPHFMIEYVPDERQTIADSWPRSVDDAHARADWGWRAQVGPERMVDDMLANLANLAKRDAGITRPEPGRTGQRQV